MTTFESQLGPGAIHFELGFGMPRLDDQMQDPLSQKEPVEIEFKNGKFKLRGRIDRVDIVNFFEEQGLLAIDYKTGSMPKSTDIAEGKNVQLALYTAALTQIFKDAKIFGGAFHNVTDSGKMRFFAKIKKRGLKYSEDEAFGDKLAKSLETVGQFIVAMRNGMFKLMPTAKCPSYCAYRQICQFSPARQEIKDQTGGQQ